MTANPTAFALKKLLLVEVVSATSPMYKPVPTGYSTSVRVARVSTVESM